MESFDSLPDDRRSPGAVMPAVMKNAMGKSKRRAPSLDGIGKRHSRKKDVRPVDEAREAKRLKVIREFHETERSYVEGLDLIYSVRRDPLLSGACADAITSIF
jgi:FYVE, RhoGEF and PH domain containing 5/6